MIRSFIKTYKDKSIKFKLFANYLLVILSAIIIFSVINATRVTLAMKETINNNVMQVIQQIKAGVEFYIRDMDNIAFYISQDDDVKKFLTGSYKNPEEERKLIQGIKQTLKIFSSSNSNIAGLLIVDAKGNLVSNDMLQITSNSLTRETWFKRAVQHSDKIQLFNKPIGRNVRNIYNHYSSDNVVSVSKAIKYPGKDYVSGVILLDLKLNSLGNIVKNSGFGEKGFFYIIDSNHEIVYTPVNSAVYRISPKWFKGREKKMVKQINGEYYQITYDYSHYTDCNIVGVFSLHEVMKVIRGLIYNMFLVGMVILMFAIPIAYLYTNSITKPLSKLQRLMNKAENGELNVQFDAKYNDEIGKLGNSFNKMIKSIKNLINMVSVEQQKKKEAELKAFQAQIKPHFLYNTLDTINWMAQEHDADEISQVVVALTTLFRISLSKGREIITLEEELLHIRSYLTIQMVRYEGKFTYDIQCDSHLLKKKVIKLILQPIVENSIYHGIKQKEGKGSIKICITETDGKIALIIEDDGLGIEVEKLKELNASLKERKREDYIQGYGIFNVNERIKLSFGNDYGIRIYSSYGKGTKVVIVHPSI